MDFVEIVNPGLFPDGDSPDRHLDGSVGDFKQRNPGIAQALFRSGMIERYGTGVPRIKRDCDAAGVRFGYRQTVNTTVIRFDRPGAQVAYTDEDGNPVPAPADAWAEKQGNGDKAKPSRQLDENEKIAVDVARERGRVSVKSLVESAGIGRDAARSTLRRLVDDGFLEWVGKGPRDPRQHYRLPRL